MNHESSEKLSRIPFLDDLSYFLAELDWLKARSTRIGSQRDSTILPLVARSRRRAGQSDQTPDCECTVKSLLQNENQIRANIDARLRLNREAGPELGLDRLCNRYQLGEFERLVLIISSIPILGYIRAGNIIDGASSIGISGSVDVEIIWAVMELDDAARIRSLASLLPESTLARERLITFGFSPAVPGDVSQSGIHVTGPALSEITGIAAFASAGAVFNSGDIN